MEIDEHVAEEVKAAFLTGILTNKQTKLFHQTSHNTQCHSATTCKARKATEVQTVNGELQENIEEEKANCHESTLCQQELQDQLDEANDKCPKPRTAGSKKLSLADMSLSGRVKSNLFHLFHLSDHVPSSSQIKPASPFTTDPLSLGGPFYELPIPNTTGYSPIDSSPASPGQESIFNSEPIPFSSSEFNFDFSEAQFDFTTMQFPSPSTNSHHLFSATNTFYAFTKTWTSKPLGDVHGGQHDFNMQYSPTPPPTTKDHYPVFFLPGALSPDMHISLSASLDVVPMTDDEGRKCSRAKVDVQDILPKGSKHAKVKSARAQNMDL
ncbi:hypothetical protein DXG01_000556 [Tephrocybe rancida]|nr:hypothetical protein DXG01_000556 [Tephrocybe rancida]